jgi:hypothetical protein
MTKYEIYQKGPSHEEGFIVYNLDLKRKEVEGDHKQVFEFARSHQTDQFFVNSPLARGYFLSRSIISNANEPGFLKYSATESFFIRLWHRIGFGD